jgi:hypothetical protein
VALLVIHPLVVVADRVAELVVIQVLALIMPL